MHSLMNVQSNVDLRACDQTSTYSRRPFVSVPERKDAPAGDSFARTRRISKFVLRASGTGQDEDDDGITDAIREAERKSTPFRYT